MREPVLVLDRGLEILGKHGSKLGDRVWDLREQVVRAALDCGRHNEKPVLACLTALKAKFVASPRVLMLEAQVREAEGKMDAATDIYDKILEADKTHSGAMKRKVCLLKSQNKLAPAVRELNSYLAM